MKYTDYYQKNFGALPQGFEVSGDTLTWLGIDLSQLIAKYGTPLRLMYLPRIESQINSAHRYFAKAFRQNKYQGEYRYAYCLKSNQLAPVVQKAVRAGAHIETSSAFDVEMVLELAQKGILSKDRFILHNGFKTRDYIEAIRRLHSAGFENSIIILDNEEEWAALKALDVPLRTGLRMATRVKDGHSFAYSRLGFPPGRVLPFVREVLAQGGAGPEMLHFFVDSGMEDSDYYFGELERALELYATLKALLPELQYLNLGGGLPVLNSADFKFDYGAFINQLVQIIAAFCSQKSIPHPTLFTEFGKYTVGESGATIFGVLAQKEYPDGAKWYFLDNSLLNTIPDAWFVNERFLLLPVTGWNASIEKVHLGGITCDQYDYFSGEEEATVLPSPVAGALYLGFFHTGAYQDAISGFGGMTHCLVPTPKQIVIDKDADGRLRDIVFSPEQSWEEVARIIGLGEKR